MRLWLVVAAIGTSACFRPTPATGVPCSETHECPGQQICDLSQAVPTCVDVLVDAAPSIADAPADARPTDARPDSAPDAPAGHTIPPGAALWLKLDDNPTDGATDSAGVHTSSCASCPALVTGRIDSAYQFTADRLDVAAAADLLPGTAFTIAAWVRVDAVPTSNVVVACKGVVTNDCSYGLLVTASVSADYYTSSANHKLGSTAMALGTWHHIAMTWDGANKTGYFDGATDGSMAATLTSDATQALSIGARNYATSPIPFPGTIDDLVFYNRVLSASEIGQLATP